MCFRLLVASLNFLDPAPGDMAESAARAPTGLQLRASGRTTHLIDHIDNSSGIPKVGNIHMAWEEPSQKCSVEDLLPKLDI